jgi:alkanesulfonate monooxygenase SsuD/methylene tetrahydromethanopterin reductase-like flavin-dependent oxidoreductase (luciferase family)
LSERVLERLGRLADGWFPQYREPDELAAGLARVHASARAAGRSPDEIGVESRVSVGNEASVGPAVEMAKRWEQAGATHLSVNTMNQGLASPAEHIAAIERFRRAWEGAGA